MNFTIEQKEQITAYIASIKIHAYSCRGRHRDVDAIIGKIMREAEKLKQYLMEIDNGRTEM